MFIAYDDAVVLFSRRRLIIFDLNKNMSKIIKMFKILYTKFLEDIILFKHQHGGRTMIV